MKKLIVLFAMFSLFGLTASAFAFEGTSSPLESTEIEIPAESPPSSSERSNIILNGDFEATTIAAGCNFNLANATVTAGMSDIVAFGGADEIDVMNDGTSCGYASAPASGVSKISIHRTAVTGGVTDAFSFGLSSSIVAGTAYTIEFYAESNLDFDPDVGVVEVGISASDASFGTLAFVAASGTGGWTHVVGGFVAPVGGDYLTVRVADGYEAWIHLDAFSVEEEATASESTDWSTIKALYR